MRKTVVPSSRSFADLVPHAGPRLRVETGRRLVEEEDLRPVDDPETDVEPARMPPEYVPVGRSAAATRSSASRTSAARAFASLLVMP